MNYSNDEDLPDLAPPPDNIDHVLEYILADLVNGKNKNAEEELPAPSSTDDLSKWSDSEDGVAIITARDTIFKDKDVTGVKANTDQGKGTFFSS